MRKIYRIGISCIGSGVGQAVINSCRLSGLKLFTVGLGNNPFAYGACDCDRMEIIPSIYADNYIEELLTALKKHQVHIHIPALDDEIRILAQALHRFEREGIKVIMANARLIEFCHDKYNLCNNSNPLLDVFVKSYDKTVALRAVRAGEITFPLLAKPRTGCASRDIRVLLAECDIDHLPAQHIVQKLAIPMVEDANYREYMKLISKGINPQLSEISVQLVTDAQGELIARMATLNKLVNGIPTEVIPLNNNRVWIAIDKLYPFLKSMGLRGPINIQGRMTNFGFKIFEMNPRFTGISGLRAMMGFNEVELCLKSWLDISNNKRYRDVHLNRYGVRQMADKSVPLERNSEVKRISVSVYKTGLKTKKTVLVTGAGGYLGCTIIKLLTAETRYHIQTLDLSKAELLERFGTMDVECFDLEDLKEGRLSLGQVDLLVHCAFGRPHYATEKLADSLAFTSELFDRAVMHQVPAVINVSSQSVYGLSRPPPFCEDLPAAPETAYGQAKYATELMACSGQRFNPQTRFTSLRLASLSGGQMGFLPIDLLGKFAEKAIKGQHLTIDGGSQIMERLNVLDAGRAIISLMEIDPQQWAEVYNVGPGKSYNICELAEMVVQAVSDISGCKKVDIVVQQKDVSMQFGMDVSKFKKATNWQPRYTIENTIESVIHYLMQEKAIRLEESCTC